MCETIVSSFCNKTTKCLTQTLSKNLNKKKTWGGAYLNNIFKFKNKMGNLLRAKFFTRPIPQCKTISPFLSILKIYFVKKNLFGNLNTIGGVCEIWIFDPILLHKILYL